MPDFDEQDLADLIAQFGADQPQPDQSGAGAPPAAVAPQDRGFDPGPVGGSNPFFLAGGDQNGVPNFSPSAPPPGTYPSGVGDPTRDFTQYVAQNTNRPQSMGFGQDRSFGPSAGYSMGPGNPATGERTFAPDMPQNERFGDAGNGYQISGYRDLGPMLSDISSGKSQIGAGMGRGMGDLGMAGILDRMYNLGEQRGMIPRGTSNQEWRQNWIDDATNNNLRTITPERQADGSINRVYGYENGRRVGEQYQAAPPKPAAPTGGGRGPVAQGGYVPSKVQQQTGDADRGFTAGGPGGGNDNQQVGASHQIGADGIVTINPAGMTVGGVPAGSTAQAVRDGAGNPIGTLITEPNGRTYTITPNGQVANASGNGVSMVPSSAAPPTAPPPPVAPYGGNLGASGTPFASQQDNSAPPVGVIPQGPPMSVIPQGPPIGVIPQGPAIGVVPQRGPQAGEQRQNPRTGELEEWNPAWGRWEPVAGSGRR